MIQYSGRDTLYLWKTASYSGNLYYPGIYNRTNPLPQELANSNYCSLIALDDDYIEENPNPGIIPGGGGTGGGGDLSSSVFTTTLNVTWQGTSVGSHNDGSPWMQLGPPNFVLTVSGCSAQERVLILTPNISYVNHIFTGLQRRLLPSGSWTMVSPGEISAEDNAYYISMVGYLEEDGLTPTTYGTSYEGNWGSAIYSSVAVGGPIVDRVPVAGNYEYRLVFKSPYSSVTVCLGRNTYGIREGGNRYCSHFTGIKLGV